MARTTFILELKFDDNSGEDGKIPILLEPLKEKAREMFTLALMLSDGSKPTISVRIGDNYKAFEDVDINAMQSDTEVDINDSLDHIGKEH